MVQSVSSVIIVGGGSAGWLTALVLSTYCPFLKIKLVRPRENAPIGVGESTQPDFLGRLMAARVDLVDFYKACDATMKCGIFYRDWNVVGDHYWHPFSNLANTGSYTAAHHYQQLILREPSRYTHERYYGAAHASYDICVKNNQVAPEAGVALHVDAKRITEYLQRFLKAVELIEADAIDVQAVDGKVTGIRLDDNRTVAADLYVDCTGFARAVFGKVASADVMHYEANVNRAVAASVPYVDVDKELAPYTRAHAHEHGWTWTIPLQSRIGSGYVYHSDFCARDEAETNFRKYWGEDRMRDVEVKHLAFQNNMLRNPWESNVIAIGLAAGFIEPLEATGLNWTIGAVDLLSRSLSARYFDADVSAQYNANIRGYIYDVQDFVDAHYKLSARRDSEFWRYQTSRAFPGRLEHRLALYATDMPNDLNRVKSVPWAFNEVSWIDILNGYRFKYAKLDVHPIQAARAEQALAAIAAAPRVGLDPRYCTPAVAETNDPRLRPMV